MPLAVHTTLSRQQATARVSRQNRIPVPNSHSTLKARSDQELKAIANENHGAYGSCLRNAVNHARLAGQALMELKARHGKYGKWGDWLEHNFDGSAESANVYMRIARNWKKIVAHGWDREDVTLTQLRALLAKRSKRQLTQKKTTEPDLDSGEDKEEALPTPSQMRQFVILLNTHDADEFDDMVEYLMPVFKTDNSQDTVCHAVRCCWKENGGDK